MLQCDVFPFKTTVRKMSFSTNFHFNSILFWFHFNRPSNSGSYTILIPFQVVLIYGGFTLYFFPFGIFLFWKTKQACCDSPYFLFYFSVATVCSMFPGIYHLSLYEREWLLDFRNLPTHSTMNNVAS